MHGVGVFVFSGSANATVDLLDYQAAVDEMQAVDPTLEPPPNDGKHDFVVGGFQALFPFTDIVTNWSVSAHSGPDGENPQGHVNMTAPTETESGAVQGRWRVTCVSVGQAFFQQQLVRVAAVGAVPRDEAASNDFPESAIFLFRDAGSGGDGDGFTIASPVIVDDPTNECGEPAFRFLATGSPPIERGNILIRDAAVELP